MNLNFLRVGDIGNDVKTVLTTWPPQSAVSASSTTGCGAIWINPNFQDSFRHPRRRIDDYDPWRPWPEPFKFPLPDPWVPWPEPSKQRAPVRRKKRWPAKRKRKILKHRAPVRRRGRDTMGKKNKKETHVALVLDKSFSMSGCRPQALAALNEQIDGLKASGHKGGKTFVSIILFSDKIDIVQERVPVAHLEHLTMRDYVLDGNTALRDAMMTAIDVMVDERSRDINQGFLVVLVSDGGENSSGTDQATLKSRIDELEGSDRWTFTYLLDGHSWEDIETLSHSGFGSSIGNYASFTNSAQGMRSAGSGLVASTALYMSSRAVGVTAKKDFYTDAKLGKQDGIETADDNIGSVQGTTTGGTTKKNT